MNVFRLCADALTLPSRWAVIAAALSVFLTAAPAFSASTFVIVNLDGAGEGLNDPSFFESVGGNEATTLGEARLRAVELATALWANSLESEVPIRVGVHFDPLGGTAITAPLGFGTAGSVTADFPGAPLTAVLYPVALAEKISGEDLSGPAEVDLDLVFNSDVDGSVVLGATRFHYGLDSSSQPGEIEFLAVAAHELAHGLGFTTPVDLTTGEEFQGLDDIFLLHLERHGSVPPDLASMTDGERLNAFRSGPDLHWTGAALSARGAALTAGVGASGHVEMHAPDPPVEGFSLAHFSASVEPDDLMEASFQGAPIDLGLALALFEDLGWGPAPVCSTVVLP